MQSLHCTALHCRPWWSWLILTLRAQAHCGPQVLHHIMLHIQFSAVMIKIPEGVLTKRHSLFRILNLLTQFSLNNTEKDNLMGIIAVPQPTSNLSWIYSSLFTGGWKMWIQWVKTIVSTARSSSYSRLGLPLIQHHFHQPSYNQRKLLKPHFILHETLTRVKKNVNKTK